MNNVAMPAVVRLRIMLAIGWRRDHRDQCEPAPMVGARPTPPM